MSAQLRAFAVVREVRALLVPAAHALRTLRTFTYRLADQRREQAQARPPTATGPKRLILESARLAAKSLRAPIVSA